MKLLRVLVPLIVLAVCGIAVNLLSPSSPRLSNKDFNTSVTGSLRVEFDKFVETKSLMPNVYPETEGKWSYRTSVLTDYALFTPDKPFKPGAEYKIVVLGTRNFFSKIRTSERELVFVTERPGNLVSATGMDSVSYDFPLDGHIELHYNKPDELRSLKVIVNPEVATLVKDEGKLVSIYFGVALKSGTTYKYSVEDLNINAIDKVLVSGTFVTVGASESPKTSSKGRVRVRTMRPRNGIGSVSTEANVQIVFDRKVNRGSAERRFSISPNVGGRFSWSDKTMTFNTSRALAMDRKYTVRVASGVTSKKALPLKSGYSGYFVTSSSRKLLNVPVLYQTYALSCEESSLRAALAFFGIFKSDLSILHKVGYNPRNRKTSNNSWDDPRKMFVGYVKGRQNTTGYGVHPGPIARAARGYGRGATAFSGWSASKLANEISKGHPVIIWGVFGASNRDGWNTSSGYRRTAKGEHTRVVVGYTGTKTNPTGFILNDPLAGRIKWSTSQLKSNWAWFDNSGVVVY